jgi:DNA-binding response OmpR family regulator
VVAGASGERKVEQMIEIHRHEPVVFVKGEEIRLSKAEHRLMVAMGMMDDKLIPTELLMDVVLENEHRVMADRQVLQQRIGRLKKKIGVDFVKCKPERGYYLTQPVRFTQ